MKNALRPGRSLLWASVGVGAGFVTLVAATHLSGNVEQVLACKVVAYLPHLMLFNTLLPALMLPRTKGNVHLGFRRNTCSLLAACPSPISALPCDSSRTRLWQTRPALSAAPSPRPSTVP